MKKFIFLLIVVPCVGFTQTGKIQGKTGFANYVFGTSPAQYKNLALEIEEGNTKLYSAPAGTIIPGVDISDVNITFLKNNLSTICYKTKNATGAKFLQVLKDNYGIPSRSNKAKGSYEWIGDKLQLVYEPDHSGKDAIVSFYSK